MKGWLKMISNIQFNAPQVQARPAFKARTRITPPKIAEKKAVTKEPGYIQLGRLQVSEKLMAEAVRKNNIEAEAQKHLLPNNWA